MASYLCAKVLAVCPQTVAVPAVPRRVMMRVMMRVFFMGVSGVLFVWLFVWGSGKAAVR
jgi:hypothetical protein